MAHSLLTVPVRELDPVVRPRLRLRSPDEVPDDDADPVAHITLLGPFADRSDLTPGVLGELGRIFADVTPFAFRLTGLSVFPSGLVYLAPSPAAPFRQLTHELSRHFPEHPPYGGAFDDVVPHLTVPLAPDERLTDLERALGPRLPLEAHAREAALYWWEPGACETLETFPFGTTAA